MHSTFSSFATSAKIQRTLDKAFVMAKEAEKDITVTDYQSRVYGLLKQIPEGKISTYAMMSQALGSSPRAVGGALRRNPFAPQVPCHRVIQADGVSTQPRVADESELTGLLQYVGGFKGEWQKAPSGLNQTMKLDILAKEGVKFDKDGFLLDKSRLWSNFNVKV